MQFNFDFLKAHALFGGLTDAQLRMIQPFFHGFQAKLGEFVIRENEVNDKVYFIVRGAVEVLHNVSPPLKKERLKRIAELGVGDSFGEMELIDLEHCAASIRALEDTELITLSHCDLFRIFKKDLATFTLITMNLAKEISRRLRRMDRLMAQAFSSKDESDS